MEFKVIGYSDPLCKRCDRPGIPEGPDPEATAPDAVNMRCHYCTTTWPSRFRYVQSISLEPLE